MIDRRKPQELPFASAWFERLDIEKNRVVQITICCLLNLKRQDLDSRDGRREDFDKWTAKA